MALTVFVVVTVVVVVLSVVVVVIVVLPPSELGPPVTFCVAFGPGGSTQHFIEGEGHWTSSKTS